LEHKKTNLARSTHIREIYSAIYRWFENPNKTFVASFREVLMPNTLEYIKENNFSVRDYMNHCFGICNDNAVMQTYSYLYELIKENYNPSDLSGIKDLKKLKNQIIQGTDPLNHDQVLKLIRQGLAHNDDEVNTPNIIITDNDDFVLKSRQFKNNFITINASDMLDLLSFFMTSAVENYKQEFFIAHKLPETIGCKTAHNISSVIKLFSLIDQQEVKADENQEAAMIELVDDYKNGLFILNSDLSYYYPFKANNQNLARHTVALTHLFETLYKNRDKCLNDGILTSLHVGNNTKDFFIGLDCDRDYLATLAHSEMYNLLTCIPPSKLQSVLDAIDIQIPANKLRNAFMHGTFFFDRVNSFCLYDGKKKTEQSLAHVGNISILDIYRIIDFVQVDRFKDVYNEPEKY
jgi:hypothetical protein